LPVDSIRFTLLTSLHQPKDRAAHQEIYAKQALLTVKDLSIGYKQRRNVFSTRLDEILALNHVSLQLYPGETLGLVGESGSGKSSLGRAILRLEEPLSGEIHFDGQNITAMNQSQFRPLRKRMQMVFQDPFQSLNPDMTVEQMLSEPIRVHGLLNDENSIKKRVQTLLERVHLPKNFRKRYPKEMSGGQRQRLCIARALALQPDFLVFDEAVSALDVSVQAQIINLINELKRDMGFSCLFISHDIGVVRFVSDRIAVLKKGEIVEQGEADQLCSQPSHEYTRSLLDAVPKGNLFT
jgi:peptide/nickel transport system ATP-binding protein